MGISYSVIVGLKAIPPLVFIVPYVVGVLLTVCDHPKTSYFLVCSVKILLNLPYLLPYFDSTAVVLEGFWDLAGTLDEVFLQFTMSHEMAVLWLWGLYLWTIYYSFYAARATVSRFKIRERLGLF
jgi:hypothetical protein